MRGLIPVRSGEGWLASSRCPRMPPPTPRGRCSLLCGLAILRCWRLLEVYLRCRRRCTHRNKTAHTVVSALSEDLPRCLLSAAPLPALRHSG